MRVKQTAKRGPSSKALPRSSRVVVDPPPAVVDPPERAVSPSPPPQIGKKKKQKMEWYQLN